MEVCHLRKMNKYLCKQLSLLMCTSSFAFTIVKGKFMSHQEKSCLHIIKTSNKVRLSKVMWATIKTQNFFFKVDLPGRAKDTRKVIFSI